jgi:heptosyltransferase-2
LSLNRSFHSALIPFLSGARVRTGFLSEGRGPLLNHRVTYDRDKSEVACYFDVLQAVAPDALIQPDLELWISEAERTEAGRRIAETLGEDFRCRCLIGIQPGASLPGKRWPPRHYAEVADTLLRDDTEARLVIIGGPDETEAASQMLAACAVETRSRAVNFAGAFDLRGSLAALSHLDLFIGNDTAVMHSAVALHVETVALFGPTNPRKWGNYGPAHRVIESCNGSMSAIEAPQVIAAARELFSLRG